MKLKALENPVRSARVVKYGKNTLTLEIETERGRYRWDVRPIYHFEIGRIELEFQYDWRSALKSLIGQSIGIFPTKLNPGGWIYAPEFSTPSLPLHHKRVAAGVVLSVVAQKRGGWSWFIDHNAKVIMRGDADTEKDAKRFAEDALRQWWPTRPRMMFNPRGRSEKVARALVRFKHDAAVGEQHSSRHYAETYGFSSQEEMEFGKLLRQWWPTRPRMMFNAKSRSAWTWKPHHQYLNVWHGTYRPECALLPICNEKFSALVEKKYRGGRWEWRVWIKRTARDINNGTSYTRRDAFRDVERAAAKQTRFLFNSRLVPARWWVGKREDGTWELGKGGSGLRRPWINLIGPFAGKHSAELEMRRREKQTAELEAKKPRTLFNVSRAGGEFGLSRRELEELLKKKGYRYKLTPQSGRFEPLYVKKVGDIAHWLKTYRDETFSILDWETGKQFKRTLMMLFNAVRR